MDCDSDVALMHNLYYNYENLGGLTGQWEPENTDEDSNASSSSSPCNKKKLRSDDNRKDSNENFTNGRASICDSPDSPPFPRFPDTGEDLVESPRKIAASVMNSAEKTLEVTETSDENKRKEEEEMECKESAVGNGEGVRWVFTAPYFFPNGTGMRSFSLQFAYNLLKYTQEILFYHTKDDHNHIFVSTSLLK